VRVKDVEGLRRSLAPLSKENVIGLLDEHEALLLERAELERLLDALRPAWRQLREVLNELNERALAPGRSTTKYGVGKTADRVSVHERVRVARPTVEAAQKKRPMLGDDREVIRIALPGVAEGKALGDLAV
jgi:hypothetical protein